jgi:hypothetical protein
MSRQRFVRRTFRAATLAVIEQANAIIDEYEAQGFTLTLRQLYYQHVSRGLIANRPSEYKRLGQIINEGRLAGLIDWDAIEDRTRERVAYQSYTDPADALAEATHHYCEDPWAGQKHRPEVWIEKDALVGVIEGVCSDYHLPHFACRGNVSQSAQYAAGRRFKRYFDQGLIPVVVYLGDHDPTGIDITRDNERRLAMFAGREVEVRRLALNIDQVERYRPPPNPAKESDSRFRAYVEEFDTENCWELDALEPAVIAELIRAEIETLINRKAWKRSKAKEGDNRAVLIDASANWAEVESFLRERNGRAS